MRSNKGKPLKGIFIILLDERGKLVDLRHLDYGNHYFKIMAPNQINPYMNTGIY